MSASSSPPAGCWFLKPPPPPRVTLVYVHPMTLESFQEPAARFVSTFLAHPPGHPHRLLVVCNGNRAQPVTRRLFAPLADAGITPEYATHTNEGHDIGAYQFASRTHSHASDLMVFFGASTYFRRSGWLARMVDAWHKHGDTLMGAMGHRGVPNGPAPHIRTTAFWLSPALFNAYPLRITRADQRYAFEHGHTCLTSWITSQGLTPLVVSWAGEHRWEEWDSHEGYHSGTQSNLLVGDRMSAPPFHHCV